MRKTSFQAYIKRHAHDETPVGDFCADTLSLLKIGKRPKRWRKADFLLFMYCQYASDLALAAFEEAWADWKAERG